MKSAVVLIVGAFTSVVAQAPKSLKTISAIEPDAVVPSRSFVLAAGGQSWFYNPSRNVWKVPFLENVYKSFGISSDGRHFLYLKSYGRMPGFSLYLYDLYEGVESLVTPDRVFHASFAPDGASFAYVKLHSVTDFELFVQSVAPGPPRRIAGGLLAPDYLEWSQDSGRLAWRTVIPLTEDFREDGKVQGRLHEIVRESGAVHTHEAGLWGEYRDNTFVYRSATGMKTGDGRILAAGGGAPPALNVAFGGAAEYSTIVQDGLPRVQRLGREGASEVAEGSIHLAIEDGLVIRDFTGSGVKYTWLDYATEATSELHVFMGRYRMPFAGRAAVIQGGQLFRAGICDGFACSVGNHVNLLGFALDMVQQVGLGQGNENILAVEDGTVLDFSNIVTCNSGGNCSDTRNPCNPSNGGAGNYVIIAHADGSYSDYLHLAQNSISVSINQRVCRGAKIAAQGHTGQTGGGRYRNCNDHLHFQRMTTLSPQAPAFSQSIPTDFEELPCALACFSILSSTNTEASPGCIALPPATITSNPVGLDVMVDGVIYKTPQTFGWPVGEGHTVTPISPQGGGGSRHVFAGWADGGPATRSIAGNDVLITYTANYQLQHQLEINITPAGAGTITTRPPAADNYFNVNTRVQVVATPSPGFQFSSWTGDLNTAEREPFITLSARRSVTANFSGAPSVSQGGVVNGADFSRVLVRGGIFSIFGRNLALSVLEAGQVPLPNRMDEVTVEVRELGRVLVAPLYFISPDQINAQMPFEVTDDRVDILVRNQLGIVTVATVPVVAAAPRLFFRSVNGRNEAIVVKADFTLVTEENPAMPGEGVFVYVNGLGPVSPAKARGEAGGDGSALRPLNRAIEPVRVIVGGIEIEAAFAGLAPDLVGVYQVNFELPGGLDSGNPDIQVRAGDQISQPGVTVPSRSQ